MLYKRLVEEGKTVDRPVMLREMTV